MTRRLGSLAMAATALAITFAPAPAAAQGVVHGCPPGTFGVTVYYRDPRGWVTVDIPLCFTISH
ncbi:MAG: hypothetical protein M3134_09285 [Actinomycetota bacterium]|nr:hypothetical protein [Actinomycetota bacterium]